MDTTTIDTATAVDLFLLLLIGIGPKIALLPYLELTADLDAGDKRRIVRTMLTTAAVVALILVVFGELLRRLLHFSTGALAIAGGILLLIIAVTMVLGHGDAGVEHDADEDPHRLAMFPLAVPYLLNPAGIVVLVTASAEARTPGDLAIVLVPLAAVLVLDTVVLAAANRVSSHLDPARMLVTEKVFGFLLAALAVQLALNGLADVGLIHAVEPWPPGVMATEPTSRANDHAASASKNETPVTPVACMQASMTPNRVSWFANVAAVRNGQWPETTPIVSARMVASFSPQPPRGGRWTTASTRVVTRPANAPMRWACASLRNATTAAATSATSTPTATRLIASTAGPVSPVPSAATATTGIAMFAPWFQAVTTTKPAVTTAGGKRQRRSMPTWVANPTASPIGRAVVIRLDVW